MECEAISGATLFSFREAFMRKHLSTLAVLTLLGTGAAFAQTTVTGQPATGGASSGTSGGQESVTRPNTDHATPGAPATTGTVPPASLEKGANSFTEGQVRSRLEQAGLRDVKDLKKDDQGIWRGQAMRDGKTVTIGFDFKGNVAVQ
jgi:periplasmic protein CpxP/Spy